MHSADTFIRSDVHCTGAHFLVPWKVNTCPWCCSKCFLLTTLSSLLYYISFDGFIGVSADVWLLVVSGDPFKHMQIWMKTYVQTHTHILYELTHSHTQHLPFIRTWPESLQLNALFCGCVAFGKWIEALCSALTSHSEPRSHWHSLAVVSRSVSFWKYSEERSCV